MKSKPDLEDNIDKDEYENGNENLSSYYDYEQKLKDKRDENINTFVQDKTMDSKEKIIKVLELEYDYLEKQQMAIFYSNEEMLKFDPNDSDLIEARAENMKFIDKNIKRMKQIQKELLSLDKDHYIMGKNLFSCFGVVDKKIDNDNNDNIMEDYTMEQDNRMIRDLDDKININKEEGEDIILTHIDL